MFRFMSREYLEEAARRTRLCSQYQAAARGFDDTVCFVVEAEPTRGVPNRYVAGMDLPAAKEVFWGEERPTGFTFTAPYGHYVDIMTGKLDPVRALTSRRLKVSGSMPKLLRYVRATQEWIRLLRTIPTEFEGEYRDRSFAE